MEFVFFSKCCVLGYIQQAVFQLTSETLRNFDSSNSHSFLCRYDNRCLTLHLYLNCCSCHIPNVLVLDRMNFCQVIIVGAGIAGLAAAKTLIEMELRISEFWKGSKMSVTCDSACSDSSTDGGAGLVNMMLTGTVLMVQAAHCSEMMVQAILHGIILH